MASDSSNPSAEDVAMLVEQDNNSTMSTDPDLDANISDTDAKFKKACHQLILLNNYIESIQVRYDRAQRNANRTARYNYRIKLCVVEGVRNMFYEYAVRLADQIDDMRRQSGMIVVREESDDAMSAASEDEEYNEEWGEEGYHSHGEEGAEGGEGDDDDDEMEHSSPSASGNAAAIGPPPPFGTLPPGDHCD